jgi:hypothetical protein
VNGHDPRPVAGGRFRVELVDGNGRSTEIGCAEVVFPTLPAQPDALATPLQEHLLLRRATGGDAVLHAWWARAAQGRAPARRSVRVTLLAADGERAVMSWRFREARPVSLHYSPLDAMRAALVMETLAVAFERVEIG